jgi:hypothetical protein
MTKRPRKFAVLIAGKKEWQWREESVDYHTIANCVGGMIELVPIGVSCCLYCNEEGKLLGLPPAANWLHRGRVHDTLMGNLILFGPADQTGNETDLDPITLEEVKEVVVPV